MIVISICMWLSPRALHVGLASLACQAHLPQTLCGPAAFDTHGQRATDPIARAGQVDDGVLRRSPCEFGLAPPARGVDQDVDSGSDHRLVEPRLDLRCTAWSATMRRVFSSSDTSSVMRFSASVFGRGEYLNENML